MPTHTKVCNSSNSIHSMRHTWRELNEHSHIKIQNGYLSLKTVNTYFLLIYGPISKSNLTNR